MCFTLKESSRLLLFYFWVRVVNCFHSVSLENKSQFHYLRNLKWFICSAVLSSGTKYPLPNREATFVDPPKKTIIFLPPLVFSRSCKPYGSGMENEAWVSNSWKHLPATMTICLFLKNVGYLSDFRLAPRDREQSCRKKWPHRFHQPFTEVVTVVYMSSRSCRCFSIFIAIFFEGGQNICQYAVSRIRWLYITLFLAYAFSTLLCLPLLQPLFACFHVHCPPKISTSSLVQRW